MEPNTYNNTTSNTHNTPNPTTGNTGDNNIGRNEQQPPNVHHADTSGTGAGVTSGAYAHNIHNPQTSSDHTNTYNPAMDNKAGPNPPGANTISGHTDQANLGPGGQPSTGYTGAADPNTHNITTNAGPTAGTNVQNTHNPAVGNQADPYPPGADPTTGRVDGGDYGLHEQQKVGHPDTAGASTGVHTTGAHTGAHSVAGPTSDSDTHNTHNPLTGDGITNTHNPMTGDRTGPHPPPGTDPATGRTAGGDLGRHNQQPAGYADTTQASAHTGTHTTGASAGVASGRDDYNTHNPMTATDRTNEGNFGHHQQRPGGYTDTTGGAHTTGTHTAHTVAGAGTTSGRDHRNTHNPLTGDGVTNTHNPMTGDKTGPYSPTDANPVTGRTAGGDLGSHEQQPADQIGATGARTGGAHTTGPGPHTGAHTGAHTGPGAGITSDRDDRNTHNPLTGDGVTNTHNPLTGGKAGPHPASDTNPATGRTDDGNLGRNQQQPGTIGTIRAGQHDHTIHDTTRGVHITGPGGTTATGTGQQPTSTKASGGGAKAALGRVQATMGAVLNNSEMHAKGVAKEQEARGGVDVRH